LTRQGLVGRLGAALDVAEAEVEAACASSTAAAAQAAERLREDTRLLNEALSAKDRALASTRETLEGASETCDHLL
jgi:hypothetical protein